MVKVARARFKCKHYTGYFYSTFSRLRKVGGKGSPAAEEPCPAQAAVPGAGQQVAGEDRTRSGHEVPSAT